MGMNSQPHRLAILFYKLLHFFNDCRKLMHQGATIGITEHECLGSASNGPLQGSQAVVAVVFKTIKEVFCIVNQVLHLRTQIGKRIFYNMQVIV